MNSQILGMSETISDWNWPKITTIKAVSATLSDRIKRLNIEINSMEQSAKIYATSADQLLKLKGMRKLQKLLTAYRTS